MNLIAYQTWEAEDSYQKGSRIPSFEDESLYSERSTPGGRSGGRSLRGSYD